jgi:hypothetical protein
MSKQEADWCKKIEIWWLLRDVKEGGYKNTTISWGTNGDRGSVGCEVNLWSEEPYARFHYTQTDNYSQEKKDFDYKVPLEKTPCHFGGSRYWFKCSLYKSGVHCGRRVGVLYKDGDWFGCRNCYELTYSSRNANRGYMHYPLFRTLELEMQAEKLHAKTRNYTYRGKPTKKRKKLERIYREMGINYQKIKHL